MIRLQRSASSRCFRQVSSGPTISPWMKRTGGPSPRGSAASMPPQRGQVIPEADPEAGGLAAVVLDQARPGVAGPAALRVPGPADVGDADAVGPAHPLVDVVVAAVGLAQLADHDR